MTLRSLVLSAAAMGLMATTVDAKDPVKPAPATASKAASTKAATPVKQASAVAPEAATVSNQKLAEMIAARLTAGSVAEGADVRILTDNGTVTIAGPCASEAQKNAILSEIRVVPGVKLVKDGLTVRSAVVPVQGQAPMTPMSQMPGAVANQLPINIGPVPEPTPLGMPGAGPGGMEAPPLPPYAWPTYAPHNNVSRVGYPTAYPYNAFPFIGPFYPFPKVPLGWRSVSLTWEDGHWWYGRTSTPQDYWRVRFW